MYFLISLHVILRCNIIFTVINWFELNLFNMFSSEAVFLLMMFKIISWSFSKRSLDVEQDWNYGTPRNLIYVCRVNAFLMTEIVTFMQNNLLISRRYKVCITDVQ